MNATSVPNGKNNATFSISADNLSKRYNREWIFKNLNYQFNAGSIYAVTGPNGSGKSTLLQVLWGQVPPTSGHLHYRTEHSEIEGGSIFRHISIATPYMDLIEEFTLLEMLDFHFKLKKIRTGTSRDELPRIMYLEDARNKQLVNFSSGMKQRLKLALAFYTEANAYFLDEPGTNLDKKAFDWYRAQLAQLPQDAAVIIASNDPDEYPDTAIRLNLMDFKP